MWLVYAVALLIVFTSLKVLNVRLHHMFDTTACLEEAWTPPGRAGSGRPRPLDKRALNVPTDENEVAFEMREMGSGTQVLATSVEGSSRASLADHPAGPSPADHSNAERTSKDGPGVRSGSTFG